MKNHATVVLAAAAASLGAGLVHAAAAGTHTGVADVVTIFAITAAAQAVVAGAVILSPGRASLLTLAGINTVAVVAWGLSRTAGLPWPDALTGVEEVGRQDLAAAVLAAAAAVLAGIAIANPRWAAAKPAPTALAGAACMVLLAVAVPGMQASHTHAHDEGEETTEHAADGHAHEATETAAPSGGAVAEPAAAIAPQAYDPDLPIDLGGVEGVTAEQQARAENLLSATVLLLPQWSDPEYDLENGFFSIGDGGTGTEHFLNPEYMSDDTILDPTRPESLVWDVDAAGNRTLSAAMFMMPPGVTIDDVPDVGGALTQWHVHDNLCFNGEGQVRALTNAEGECPPGLTKGAETPMIHVWIRPARLRSVRRPRGRRRRHDRRGRDPPLRPRARRHLTRRSPSHDRRARPHDVEHLNGKVVVVTGGASGIGLALAQAFAGEGSQPRPGRHRAGSARRRRRGLAGGRHHRRRVRRPRRCRRRRAGQARPSTASAPPTSCATTPAWWRRAVVGGRRRPVPLGRRGQPPRRRQRHPQLRPPHDRAGRGPRRQHGVGRRAHHRPGDGELLRHQARRRRPHRGPGLRPGPRRPHRHRLHGHLSRGREDPHPRGRAQPAGRRRPRRRRRHRRRGGSGDVLGAIVEGGIEPADVAAKVVDAVKADRFYVLPHDTTLDAAEASLGGDRGQPAAVHLGARVTSWTYRDVDRSADPAEAAAWMDRIALLPGFAEAKARSLELLADAVATGVVLDLGCGVGEEVRRLGPSALGVDTSTTMLAVAAERGGRYVRGDAHRLPLRAGSLAGARADRVLQHLDDPVGVIDAMRDALRGGGRLVLVDPDQATLAIDGVDPDLSEPIIDFRARDGIRNGFLPGRYDEVLSDAGFSDVDVERFETVRDDPHESFGLPTWAAMLVERGRLDQQRADAFDAAVAAAHAAGTFAYRVDLVVASGRRSSG